MELENLEDLMAEHDKRLDGYHSGNESELEEPDAELVCSKSNAHSKMAKAGRCKPFMRGPNGEIVLRRV